MLVNTIKRLVAGMLCGCLSVATFCYDAAAQKAVSEDDGAIVINSQEDLEKLYGNDNIYFENVDFSDGENEAALNDEETLWDDEEENEVLCDTEDTSALPSVYAANATEGDVDAKAINPNAGGITVKWADGSNIGSQTIEKDVLWEINGTVHIKGKIVINTGVCLTVVGGKGVATDAYGGRAVVRIISHVNEDDATFYVKEGGELIIKAKSSEADSLDPSITTYYDRIFISGSGDGYISTVPIIRCANSSNNTSGTILKLLGVDLRNNSNNNSGDLYGGAISVNGQFKTLEIKNVQVYQCAAVQGGAMAFHNEFRMVSGTAIFENFKATHCYASEQGGAILIRQGANDGDSSNLLFTNLTFKNCTFNECYSGYQGGAIYINGKITDNKGTRINGALTIEGCTFSNCFSGKAANYTAKDEPAGFDGMTYTEISNKESAGGAIYLNCRVISTSIKNSSFTNCSSVSGGSTIHFHSSYACPTTTISGCNFTNCYSRDTAVSSNLDDNGGTVRTVGATATLLRVTNCTFTRNYSRNNGGGVYWNAAGTYGGTTFNVSESRCIISGCTFDGNWCAHDGGAVFCESRLEITGQNEFKNNRAGYKYNNTATSRGRGGAILQKVYNGSARQIVANEETSIVLSNQTSIHNNSATHHGGGVCILANWSDRFDSLNSVKTHTVSFTLGGASIFSNEAGACGGGVYFDITDAPSNTTGYYGSPALYKKTIYLNEGNVYSNRSNEGGGVYMNGTSSTIEITNAEVYGNVATVHGGGIYLTGASCEIDVSGGRVYANRAGSIDANGNLILSNGEIATPGYGAGMYIMGESENTRITVNISGGLIGLKDNPNTTAADDGANIASGNGGGIYTENADITFVGGKIEYNKSNQGAGIFAYGKTSILEIGSKDGSSNVSISNNDVFRSGAGVYAYYVTMTIYSGEINNNHAVHVGGGIRLTRGRLDIYGGSISNNTCIGGNPLASLPSTIAVGQGGGVYMTGTADYPATFNMYGGKISGNHATGFAGGLFIGEMATGTLKEDANGNTGSVYSNRSDSNGGGVYITKGGIFILENGSVGKKDGDSSEDKNGGNTAADCGGGIYVHNGMATISNGSIAYNSAGDSGGGVAIVDSSTLTLNGGSISNNEATNSGGGVYAYFSEDTTTTVAPTITVNGGNASANIAGQNGGGVCAVMITLSDNTVLRPTVTINGGNIGGATEEEGNSASHGGGVYIDGAKFALNASVNATGSISNNTATYDGGGAYIKSTADAITIAGDISHNIAGGNGGGAYITDTTALVSIGGNASDNTAYENGGGLYLKNAKVSLAGNLTGNTSTAMNIMEGESTTDTGDGGGAYVSGGNAQFTIAAGGSVSGNVTDGNGGGIAAFDGAVVNLNGGFVGGKDNGNIADYGYGGGVYASNATVNITGSDICYNEAKNGGGVCATDGGELKMTGGLLRYNKANGMPAEGITTSWHENTVLAGVGGGVYLSEGVDANMSTYELTGTDTFGIYGNLAEWAADDVFANGVYTKLTLPSALSMTLADTEFSRATGWFEDYNNGDTKYESGLRGDINVGGRRYRETERTVIAYINAADASGDSSASTVYINTENTYVCLTLGTAKEGYGEITITKKGEDIDPTQVFVFRISGNGMTFYATVTGTGTVRITDVPDGTYTVTEIVDWAWRYELESITIDNDKNQAKSSVSLTDLCGTIVIDSGDTSPDIEFVNKLTRDKWLGSNSEVEKNVAGSTTAAVDNTDSFVVYLEQPRKKEPVVTEEDAI